MVSIEQRFGGTLCCVTFAINYKKANKTAGRLMIFKTNTIAAVISEIKNVPQFYLEPSLKSGGLANDKIIVMLSRSTRRGERGNGQKRVMRKCNKRVQRKRH
jgi:hypothetical protein